MKIVTKSAGAPFPPVALKVGVGRGEHTITTCLLNTNPTQPGDHQPEHRRRQKVGQAIVVALLEIGQVGPHYAPSIWGLMLRQLTLVLCSVAHSSWYLGSQVSQFMVDDACAPVEGLMNSLLVPYGILKPRDATCFYVQASILG